MLMTFDKYNLLLLYDNNHYIYIYILKYVVKEIDLLFFKCVQMFRHKSKGKGKKGNNSSSSQARSGMSADLFAVIVYLIFIYMSLFIITLLLHLIYFIITFVCRALRSPDTGRRPFLRL
jgi:fatty acid desaturase